jgi:hypothetical protein
MLGLSSILNADLTRDTSTSIVTDSETGLQWLDDEPSPSKLWEEAITYCEDKDIGGKADWRLANINELSSIFYSTGFNDTFENDFMSDLYWSSTTHASITNGAWSVNFGHGSQDSNGAKDFHNFYVRCVRAEQ